MKLRAIILGCGSSGGVPRVGGPDGRGDWGLCDPSEPKNQRTRASAVIQRSQPDGCWDGPLTTLLIDTSPDLRLQLIREGIGRIDAVAITHDHADQTHGIDDLRALAIAARQRLPVYISDETSPDLVNRFAYVFKDVRGTGYPPILERLDMPEEGVTATIDGPTGPIPLTPFLQEHGRVSSHGFRCGPFAYSADVNDLYAESWDVVSGAECWIIDALRREPHVSHLHLDKALAFIERARCRRGVLTNLHVTMDYRSLLGDLPGHVVPAHDGLVVEAELPSGPGGLHNGVPSA